MTLDDLTLTHDLIEERAAIIAESGATTTKAEDAAARMHGFDDWPDWKRTLEKRMAEILTSGRLDPMQVLIHAQRFGLTTRNESPDAGEIWRKEG